VASRGGKNRKIIPRTLFSGVWGENFTGNFLGEKFWSKNQKSDLF